MNITFYFLVLKDAYNLLVMSLFVGVAVGVLLGLAGVYFNVSGSFKGALHLLSYETIGVITWGLSAFISVILFMLKKPVYPAYASLILPIQGVAIGLYGYDFDVIGLTGYVLMGVYILGTYLGFLVGKKFS